MSEYFSNIIYGVKSFLTGMKLTLEHFNNKKERVATLQYPHEKWPVPERNIGFDHSEYNLIRSRLHVDIDDCISCMQCEKFCPVDCIKIDAIKPPKDSDMDCGITSNDTQKKMIVTCLSACTAISVFSLALKNVFIWWAALMQKNMKLITNSVSINGTG